MSQECVRFKKESGIRGATAIRLINLIQLRVFGLNASSEFHVS